MAFCFPTRALGSRVSFPVEGQSCAFKGRLASFLEGEFLLRLTAALFPRPLNIFATPNIIEAKGGNNNGEIKEFLSRVKNMKPHETPYIGSKKDKLP